MPVRYREPCSDLSVNLEMNVFFKQSICQESLSQLGHTVSRRRDHYACSLYNCKFPHSQAPHPPLWRFLTAFFPWQTSTFNVEERLPFTVCDKTYNICICIYKCIFYKYTHTYTHKFTFICWWPNSVLFCLLSLGCLRKLTCMKIETQG